MKRFSLTVSDEQQNLRLDRLLVSALENETRARIQKWIAEGLVYANGRKSKASYRVRAGDVIEIRDIPERPASEIDMQLWDVPIEVLYEDPHLLAVSKPAHVVVHPGAGRRHQTLANALLYHYPELREVGHPARPGIVHRLDKETSGLLLLARNTEAYHRLTVLFKNRQIEKHYRAVALGAFRSNEGRIAVALGRDPKDRKKISTRARKARSAITLYRVLKHLEFGALLDVQILTGRTHQIRVHLASERHPILGDTVYGGSDWNRIANANLRSKLQSATFFGLHSFSLDFIHPITMETMHLEAPLPQLWNLF